MDQNRNKIIFDGQVYKPGDIIPNLGSLVGTDIGNGRRAYEGKNSDASKLPKYPSLATGSKASLIGSDGLHVYKYEATAKKWTELS